MPEPKPYALSDQTIKSLNRKALRRSERCKQRLLLEKFDELYVMQEIDALYSAMDRDNRAAFKKLFIRRFTEVLLYLRGKSARMLPDDEIDELAEMYITDILAEPNGVTHFAYDTEVLRKRDRAKEAVNSVSGQVQKQDELNRQLRLWSRQTGWYCDIASDAASEQAMKTDGVKHVKWNTQEDEKVCEKCGALDGKIYPIDKIPPKPHPFCRCWFSPEDVLE